MSYEAHKKSSEGLSSAETSLSEARSKLEEAERRRAQAADEYKRILEEAKNKITPALVEEAYEEYKKVLEERVLSATREGKYAEARKILEELEGLKGGYGEMRTIVEEDETPMRSKIEQILRKHNVIDSDQREHYFNRAGYLQGLGRLESEIIGALEKEIATPVKKRKMIFPWTGS